jgi:enamine deaminase RidA (YjgF/YER057c/UK114 family)
MALGGGRVHVVDQVALVPDVVAGGQNIRAQIEEFLGKLRRNAEATGGILGVDDDQLDVVSLTKMTDVLADNAASGTSEYIADEEKVQ